MNTVPGVRSSSCAVSALPRVVQSPISPAPTKTAGADGVGAEGEEDDPEQAVDTSAASTKPAARFIYV